MESIITAPGKNAELKANGTNWELYKIGNLCFLALRGANPIASGRIMNSIPQDCQPSYDVYYNGQYRQGGKSYQSLFYVNSKYGIIQGWYQEGSTENEVSTSGTMFGCLIWYTA